MLRICVWIPKKLSDGRISEEELCMPVGPIIPIGGYIDPPDVVRDPERWSLTLNGKELPISGDLQRLSAISSIAAHVQDERIRDAIQDGLRVALEITTEGLPENLSLRQP